jgi:membrane protease YdiL (CAAX protease family)
MNNTNEALKKKRSTFAFFVLTYIISIPAYIIATLVPQEMVMLTGLIIALAPISAALILTYRNDGLSGAKILLKRSFDIKRITRKIWYGPIFFLIPILFLLALGIMSILGEPLPDTLFPIVAAPVAFLMFFLFALFEEVGWMGYAYDSLEEQSNALRASFILGIIWATWHIPLYILSGQGTLRIIVQLISLLALRTLFVWIYKNTGKSVFATILVHAVYNVCTLTFASFYSSLGHLITSTFIIITAMIVLFTWDQETLTHYRFGKGENKG